MHPDELSEANKKVARQRLLTLYLAGAIVLAGLLLLLAMKYLGPADTTTQPVPIQQEITIPADDGAELREQFKLALKDYETNIEGQLAMANLPAWNLQADHDIQAFKQQALSAFSQGDYKQALKAIMDAGLLAEQTLTDWSQRYSAAYSSALAFFNDMSPDKAKLSIDEALTLKPAEPDALTLKQRIDRLPEVKQLLDEANIAHIENDIRKRYRILQQVTALDPLRVELQDEISQLAQHIAEEDFAAYINAGLKAVDHRQLTPARSALRSAKAIFPSRREIQILSGRISALARALSLSSAIRKGDQAAKRDNWSLALITYQQALKTHPDNGELIKKVKLARRITSLSQSISDYVDRHHRLASPNVAAMAEKTLQDAKAFTDMSKSLVSKSIKLASLLERYSQPAELMIWSDNLTYITIRRVGKVGVVTQKLVRLRPGKYTLEGRRPGYKSKLLNIDIKLGQARLEVEVICNERI